METIEVISTDRATVFIQMNPQADQDSTIFVDGQKATSHNAALKVFFKVQPKALGTVQIMIGVVIFFLGILFTIDYPNIVIISGITYWGSFIYISAGSLSVAAQNKLNLCLVKASLIMNVISAITAGIAILLLSIELIASIASVGDPWFYPEGLRITVILLVFTIPQFIISLFISAFACKATCDRDSTVVNVLPRLRIPVAAPSPRQAARTVQCLIVSDGSNCFSCLILSGSYYIFGPHTAHLPMLTGLLTTWAVLSGRSLSVLVFVSHPLPIVWTVFTSTPSIFPVCQ
ncbi:membrane-spanning 4-domains subfamily A member 4D-like [Chanodichthys erythropterus]|uniref:membrane-spanning 4-domains subfamily A member 4D-like n=1 Tax=Chanodichthys erythropterus TaxID=933992 RepID=UPI00351E2CC9